MTGWTKWLTRECRVGSALSIIAHNGLGEKPGFLKKPGLLGAGGWVPPYGFPHTNQGCGQAEPTLLTIVTCIACRWQESRLL
jgi:hypothetical protein